MVGTKKALTVSGLGGLAVALIEYVVYNLLPFGSQLTPTFMYMHAFVAGLVVFLIGFGGMKFGR